MAKQQTLVTDKPSQTVIAGALEQTLKHSVKASHARTSGGMAKSDSKRAKASAKGVTKKPYDYSHEGFDVGKTIWTADAAAWMKQCEALTVMAKFASQGFKPNTLPTQKKRLFTEEVESFFNGMKKFQETIPDAERKSFGPRYAEARRVCHAYILRYSETGDKGVQSVTNILMGKGTYAQKIAALPTMSAGGQGKREAKAGGNGESNTVKLAKAAKDQRVGIIKQMSAPELDEIVQNADEGQLQELLRAAAIRCSASKDKVFKKLGETIAAVLKAVKTDSKPENKQQVVAA